MAKNWIAGAVGSGEGKLHKSLQVPKGQKIPAVKLAKAAKTGSPKVKKEVSLANTLKSFKKK